MVAANVFVRAPDSASPYFLSRGAALRSYFLRQAITRYAVDPDAVVDITVPDVTAKALEVTLDSAERRFKADEDVIALTARAKVDAADRATVDELDGEALATVVGAAHQLGVQPLLGLASAKLAERMSSGEAAWWTDDLLSPARDLSDADTKAAGREYIFTAPAAPAAADVPRLAAATEQSDDLLRTRAAAAAAAEAAAAGNGSSGHHHTLSIPLSAAAPEAAATAECKLLRWLGSESALASCLARLDGPSLARLKALGSVWRERARAALSSTTWREWQRSASRLELGSTLGWTDAQRCEAARFVSTGGLRSLRTLCADGFELELAAPLLAEQMDAQGLMAALTVNPCSASRVAEADALCSQNRFLCLAALHVLGHSEALVEADLRALNYSGLQPLAAALPAAVELGGRRALRSLTLSACALPVREMIGLPAAPGDGAGCLSPPAASAAASSCLALKWKRLSALDAALLAALLEHNPRITQLDLSWNTELGDAAPALGAAIEASRTLADVNLSETSVCARPEGVAALRRAITAAPALVRLNLQHSGACAEAAASLFEAAAARLRGGRPAVELLV